MVASQVAEEVAGTAAGESQAVEEIAGTAAGESQAVDDAGGTAAPAPEVAELADDPGVAASDAAPHDESVVETVVESTSSEFTLVDVGRGHACGLRTDSTVACWGENNSGESVAPDGRFNAVGAGWEYSCGLREDATVACWGAGVHDPSQLPDGRFSVLSVGEFASCGLRDDGAVECWEAGRSDPSLQSAMMAVPDGEFTAVSVGSSQACALRTDGGFVCWGLEDDLRIDESRDRFQIVDVGVLLTCGLRVDGSVVCWNAHKQESTVPSGTFTSISVGFEYGCGLRPDDTALCWGFTLKPLSGQFTALSAGLKYTCGLRADGSVDCWGAVTDERTRIPPGSFSSVHAGGAHTCGLRDDAAVVCWGGNSNGQSEAATERFAAVAAGTLHSCGLRSDATVTCWGYNEQGQADPPGGRFEAIAVGDLHSCGVRADAAIVCWGDNDGGQADPPGGRFESVAAGAFHSCGVRIDATVVCWGSNDSGQADAPDGRFEMVAAGGYHSCGVRADARVVCWGDSQWGQTDSPGGSFSSVAAGLEHSCGLRADGTVTCWGQNISGQADAPSGVFVAVSAGWSHSCGARSDGSVVCWGHLLYQPAPAGVTLHTTSAWPAPPDCRPHKGEFAFGPGFPLNQYALPSTGTLRVAVVFVDFGDAAAAYSVQREAEAGLPFAEQYLESASHGKLDVEFVALDRWLRLEHGYAHYSFTFEGEAARLADEHFDFSDFDVMMAVAPSSTFAGGLGGGIVTTDEGSVTTVQVNSGFSGSHGNSPALWGFTAAHELMHNLGLADLYDLDDTAYESATIPAGKELTWIEFGLMGLSALFLGDEDDPARAYESIAEDGFSSTGMWFNFTAGEMLSWSRWQLGWLEPHQIACVTDDTIVHLEPVATDPKDGIAMAAVPLSDREAVVIESRRKIGHDALSEQLLPDGTRRSLPALGPEGVLVYTVDASIGSAMAPIKVVGRTDYGVFDDYPLLAVGDSVTVRGYTIAVVADDGHTHTVTITRTGG